MNSSIIQIQTKDGLQLPGMLYEAKDSQKAAIFLHGNGSSSVFYNHEEFNDQIEALNKIGISYLVFNNRGAHFIKSFKVVKNGQEERLRFGMAYEQIKDCVLDIDGAIGFLENTGYKEFYLIGESTGANKICVYDHYKPKNKVARYILLSGGDDAGIYYDILKAKKFYRLLSKSKEMILKGKGSDLVKELLPDEIFSYISFVDICDPDGDYNCFPYLETLKDLKLSAKPLFRYYKGIKKPTLVVYGENDEYAWGDVPKIVSILGDLKPEFDYRIIKNADHGFSGHQKELATVIGEWLKK